MVQRGSGSENDSIPYVHVSHDAYWTNKNTKNNQINLAAKASQNLKN
jgi:hypothetical protein